MMRTAGAMMMAALLGCAPVIAAPVAVRILAINDLHGGLEPTSGPGGKPIGGVEYLATHLQAAARAVPNTIIVGDGDLIGASPLLSGIFGDEPTLRSVNALGLTLTSLGNHELDLGLDSLRHRLAGQCDGCEPVRYAYLSANLTLADGTRAFPASMVRTINGVKIGFIGATLKDTIQMIPAKAAAGLRVGDEATAINAATTDLEAQGVHAIVLLLHEGGQAQGDDPNGCAGFTGRILPILERLSPTIRVVVSGHTHKAYNCEIGGRRVASAAYGGRMFTRIDLTVDDASDRILTVRAVNAIVTDDVARDAAQTAILDSYRPRAKVVSDRRVGASAHLISHDVGRSGQSDVGRIVANSMLAATTHDSDPAQVALINHGGVRSDIPGPMTLTFGQMYRVLPFSNHLVSLTLTGEQIRRLLEQQFLRAGDPDILQASDGFSYRYRAKAPPGQHVDAIRVNGRPIAPQDRIRVVVPDFLQSGGDGFTVLAEGTAVQAGEGDVAALTAYVAKSSPLKPLPPSGIRQMD